jgi:hypothetical protein
MRTRRSIGFGPPISGPWTRPSTWTRRGIDPASAAGCTGRSFAVLGAQRFCNAFAGIALPNPASVALHEAVGFEPLGVYRRSIQAQAPARTSLVAAEAFAPTTRRPMHQDPAAVQRRSDWPRLLRRVSRSYSHPRGG